MMAQARELDRYNLSLQRINIYEYLVASLDIHSKFPYNEDCISL